MAAYYNEFDKQTAQWLRNLIAEGLIAPGDVDERSILDVKPDDLRGYTQCHFFAGIGVWSRALRRSGWDDSRPVWTGSCPCQPFSSAGAQSGFADERHLWPAFYHLISECRPPVVFGEQVASKAVDPWVDLVHADLEALGYSFGCVPFPSAGVGAPHIRDRAFWVAEGLANTEMLRFEREWWRSPKQGQRGTDQCCISGGMADASCARPFSGALTGIHRVEESAGARNGESERHCAAVGMAHSERNEQRRRRGTGREDQEGDESRLESCGCRPFGGMADAEMRGRREKCSDSGGIAFGDRPERHPTGLGDGSCDLRTGPVNGFWLDADWLFCRDGKWRPVEPGTFPLAHGAPARVVRLRAYGNAINAKAAEEFIGAYLESRELLRSTDLIGLDPLI